MATVQPDIFGEPEHELSWVAQSDGSPAATLLRQAARLGSFKWVTLHAKIRVKSRLTRLILLFRLCSYLRFADFPWSSFWHYYSFPTAVACSWSRSITGSPHAPTHTRRLYMGLLSSPFGPWPAFQPWNCEDSFHSIPCHRRSTVLWTIRDSGFHLKVPGVIATLLMHLAMR